MFFKNLFRCDYKNWIKSSNFKKVLGGLPLKPPPTAHKGKKIKMKEVVKMKEIMLKKCETDIIYLYDYLGNLICFKQLYEDKEENIYELFFSATIEGRT